MADREDLADDAFWEGVQAARQGREAASNPYPAGCCEGIMFDAGFAYSTRND